MNSFPLVTFEKYHMFHHQFSCLKSSLNGTFYRFDLSSLEEEIWAILWEGVFSGLVLTGLILAVGD